MEQIISFETAKILKERNFFLNVKGWYTREGKLIDSHTCSNEFHGLNGYPAPSQSVLQSWLRNHCKVLVLINPIDSWRSWKYTILMEDIMSPFFEPDYDKFNQHLTYEDALESGLINALKLLP